MLLTPPYVSNLVALVIDEAHCVRTWGDEFQLAFAKIGDICSLLPEKVGVHALTATATTVTKRLSMESPNLIALPPFRENIR